MGEHDELWPVRCGPSIQMRVLPESVAAPTPLSADAPPLKVLIWLFFQAEDGIRDIGVTGVQTCALPISARCENLSTGETDASSSKEKRSRLSRTFMSLPSAKRRLPWRKAPSRPSAESLSQ